MSRICFTGIGRDAMRFQFLDAILDWLANGHITLI